MNTRYTTIESPLGPLLLTSDGESLTRLYMSDHKHRAEIEADWVRDDNDPVLLTAAQQLKAYFDGNLTKFDLPLALAGTEFQKRVWRELQTIGFGETLSYGELAERIGSPSASRAVGLANGRNPVSIIVPCHRVIGANGKLTGYGGGINRKAALLDLEASVLRGERVHS